MSALSSRFYPPSNRRKCVKGRTSYTESSDNILSGAVNNDHINDSFDQMDYSYMESGEPDDVDEEPITIDLSAFLNENPLLVQSAFQNSFENNVASTESSSQFRVTDCEVKPSDVNNATVPKTTDSTDLSSTTAIADNVYENTAIDNCAPPMFLASTLVSDAHDSIKENCLNSQMNSTPAIVNHDSAKDITLNGKKTPIKKFNRAKPLGLSNPLKKYKNFMKSKDINKTNMKVFGKYPVVKCEKLDIENFVKTNKIKVSNWPLQHANKIENNKSFIKNNIVNKRISLTKAALQPKLRKPISFSEYHGDSNTEAHDNILTDPFDSMSKSVVIKTDSWKPEITKTCTPMLTFFKSPPKNPRIIPKGIMGNILTNDMFNDNLTESFNYSSSSQKIIVQKRKGPIITSVNKVSNIPKTFKFIAPKPVMRSPDVSHIKPKFTKPLIKAVAESVLNEYTVIEPYVDDPCSPIKPKPILTVPVEIIPSPEKQSTMHNNVILNENLEKSPKTVKSVFLNGAIKQISTPSRSRKEISSEKKNIEAKRKYNRENILNSYKVPVNVKDESPEETDSILKAKTAVVDAMQNVFTSLHTVKKPKTRLVKTESSSLMLLNDSPKAKNFSYNSTLNDLLYGFTETDFEDSPFHTEDESNTQSSLASLSGDFLTSPVQTSFSKMDRKDSEHDKIPYEAQSQKFKRKICSGSSPTSDTLSASECEYENNTFKNSSKSKFRKITPAPKCIFGTMEFASVSDVFSKSGKLDTLGNDSVSSVHPESINYPENNNKDFYKHIDSSLSSNLENSFDTKSDDEIKKSPTKLSNRDIQSEIPNVICNENPTSSTENSLQNKKSHKENSPVKAETCTRTLRERKCSSTEVDKFSDSSIKQSQNNRISDDQSSKLAKGSINSKLKIQMKTPPKSTAKVKIKRKSKPDDIIREINTITGGRLKLQKGLKHKESNSENVQNTDASSAIIKDDSESNSSVIQWNNKSSRAFSKKKRTLKVCIKRSKKKKAALTVPLNSLTDVLENANSTSSLPENNVSLHSSFREGKAEKMGTPGKEENTSENVPSISENNVDNVGTDEEQADGGQLLSNEQDSMVNSAETLTEGTTHLLNSDYSNTPDSSFINKNQSLDVVCDLEKCIEETKTEVVTELVDENERNDVLSENNKDVSYENDLECSNLVPDRKSDASDDVISEGNVISKDNVESGYILPSINLEESIGTKNTETDEISTDMLFSPDDLNKCLNAEENEIITALPHVNKEITPNDNSDEKNEVTQVDDCVTILDNTENTEIIEDKNIDIELQEHVKNSDILINEICEDIKIPEQESGIEDSVLQSAPVAINNVDSSENTASDVDTSCNELNFSNKDIIDKEPDSDSKQDQVSPETCSGNNAKSERDRNTRKCPKIKISLKNSDGSSPDSLKNWFVSESKLSESSDEQSHVQNKLPEEVSSKSVNCSIVNSETSFQSELKDYSSDDIREDNSVSAISIEVDKSDEAAINSPVLSTNLPGDITSTSQGLFQELEKNVDLVIVKEEPMDFEDTIEEDINSQISIPFDIQAVKVESGTEKKKSRGRPRLSTDSTNIPVNTKLKKVDATLSEDQSIAVTPKLKGRKMKATSTPIVNRSTPGGRQKNYVPELVIVPFSMGWMREHVLRATEGNNNKRQSDIYYFGPDGKKLRSMPEITTYLSKHTEIKLSAENFTFAKELIYREPFEIERDARQVLKRVSISTVNKKSPSKSPNKRKSLPIPLSNIKQEFPSEDAPLALGSKKKYVKRKSSPLKGKKSNISSLKDELLSANVSKSTKQTSLDEFLDSDRGNTPTTIQRTGRRIVKKVPFDNSLQTKVTRKSRSKTSNENIKLIIKSPIKVSKPCNSNTEKNNLCKSNTEKINLCKSNTEKINLCKSNTEKNNLSTDTSTPISTSEITSHVFPERTSNKSSAIQNRLKVKFSRKSGHLHKPCNKFCNFSHVREPVMKCSICLCLFHEECIPYYKPHGAAKYACIPCIQTQLKPDKDTSELFFPADFDMKLLYPISSLQIIQDPNFDLAFNKFYSPVDQSFVNSYQHNYGDSNNATHEARSIASAPFFGGCNCYVVGLNNCICPNKQNANIWYPSHPRRPVQISPMQTASNVGISCNPSALPAVIPILQKLSSAYRVSYSPYTKVVLRSPITYTNVKSVNSGISTATRGPLLNKMLSNTTKTYSQIGASVVHEASMEAALIKSSSVTCQNAPSPTENNSVLQNLLQGNSVSYTDSKDSQDFINTNNEDLSSKVEDCNSSNSFSVSTTTTTETNPNRTFSNNLTAASETKNVGNSFIIIPCQNGNPLTTQSTVVKKFVVSQPLQNNVNDLQLSKLPIASNKTIHDTVLQNPGNVYHAPISSNNVLPFNNMLLNIISNQSNNKNINHNLPKSFSSLVYSKLTKDSQEKQKNDNKRSNVSDDLDGDDKNRPHKKIKKHHPVNTDNCPQTSGALKDSTSQRSNDSHHYSSFWDISKFAQVYECLNLIFKFLDVCDLLRASLVCRSWKHLTTQKFLWENISLSGLSITDWKKCCRSLQKYGTKLIDFRGILDQDSIKAWKPFSDNLKHLIHVEELIFEKVPPFIIKNIADCLPQLKKLSCYSLTSVFIEPEIWSTPCEFELASLRYLGRLQVLKISSTGGIALDDRPQSLMPYLPKLTHLALTGFKFYSYMNLECLSQQQQLISLELGDCADIEPQIYGLLAKLTNLENLCLQNGGSISDTKLSEAVSKMTRLENLELMNFKVSNHLSDVVKKLECLTSFSVWPDNSSEAAAVNFNFFQAVTSCSNLKNICWGILHEADGTVPDVLQLKDPAKAESDVDTLTFQELFQTLVKHFPGNNVEMKCLPRPT